MGRAFQQSDWWQNTLTLTLSRYEAREREKKARAIAS